MRWMLINKVKLLFKTITKHSAHWVLGALFGFRRFCHSVVVFSHLWRDCVETPRSACGCPFRRAELNLPWKGRGTSGAGGGVLCGIFCFMYQISRKHPSVTCGDSFPFRGARWNLPWKGRRTVVRRWRGSLWNLLLNIIDLGVTLTLPFSTERFCHGKRKGLSFYWL